MKKPQYFRFTVDKIVGKMTEHSVTLASEAPPRPVKAELEDYIVATDHTFVDEVVIGNIIHIEAMSRRSYWMNIGGITVWVYLRKDGTVKEVEVFNAGDYDEPHEGVKYRFGMDEVHAAHDARKKKRKKK